MNLTHYIDSQGVSRCGTLDTSSAPTEYSSVNNLDTVVPCNAMVSVKFYRSTEENLGLGHSIIILFLDNKVIYDVIYNQFPLRNFDGNKGWYRRVTVEECHVSISLRLATCVSTSIMRSVMRWKGLTCNMKTCVS